MNSMHSSALNGSSDSAAESVNSSLNRSEAAQRFFSEASNPEVLAIKRRRMISPAEKRRILQAYDRCKKPGERGAVLRRERVYSSMLTGWRKHDRAALGDAAAWTEGQSSGGAAQSRCAAEPRDRPITSPTRASERDHRCPKKTMYLARTADGRGPGVDGLMEVFAELRPQIGIAAACVALSINRAGIYRARARLARRHGAMFPRKRRPRPPLALSEARSVLLLLVLNSERFADLAPAAVFAILLDEGRYHGSVRTMYRLLAWTARAASGASSAPIRRTRSRSCWPFGRRKSGPGT